MKGPVKQGHAVRTSPIHPLPLHASSGSDEPPPAPKNVQFAAVPLACRAVDVEHHPLRHVAESRGGLREHAQQRLRGEEELFAIRLYQTS